MLDQEFLEDIKKHIEGASWEIQQILSILEKNKADEYDSMYMELTDILRRLDFDHWAPSNLYGSGNC